jgi:hypothetical protein
MRNEYFSIEQVKAYSYHCNWNKWDSVSRGGWWRVVFRVVTPFSLVSICPCGIYCLQLQGQMWRQHASPKQWYQYTTLYGVNPRRQQNKRFYSDHEWSRGRKFKGATVTYWKALWSGRGKLRPEPQVAWLILEPDIAGFLFRRRGISLQRQDRGVLPMPWDTYKLRHLRTRIFSYT